MSSHCWSNFILRLRRGKIFLRWLHLAVTSQALWQHRPGLLDAELCPETALPTHTRGQHSRWTSTLEQQGPYCVWSTFSSGHVIGPGTVWVLCSESSLMKNLPPTAPHVFSAHDLKLSHSNFEEIFHSPFQDAIVCHFILFLFFQAISWFPI